MRVFLSLSILASCLFQTATSFAQEGLFSEVAMESVFSHRVEDSTIAVATPRDGNHSERITGTSSLTQSLKTAGFTPKLVNEAVQIQIEHAGWKLPTSLRVDIENDRIHCDVSLIEITEVSDVDTSILLQLLEKSDLVRGTCFAYNGLTRQIQLQSSFSNRSVSPKQLQSKLMEIAEMADRHSQLWSQIRLKSAVKSAGKSDKIIPQNPTAPQSAGEIPLTGLWSATLGTGETAAIQIGRDSKFKFVTVRQGKSSVSTGTVVRHGEQMSLIGDDKVTLSGRLSHPNADQFRFSINDKNGKPQLVMDFTKSK